MMSLAFKKCSDSWKGYGPLVLRLALGAIFFYHGYDKVFVKGIPAITGFMASLNLPLPMLMAYLVSYGELIGGAMLIVGLLTYWVSIVDIIIATVAFVTVHMANGFSIASGGYEYIMLIFAASVSLLMSGAGKYSLDEKLMERK